MTFQNGRERSCCFFILCVDHSTGLREVSSPGLGRQGMKRVLWIPHRSGIPRKLSAR
jgi:hypothetical protein